MRRSDGRTESPRNKPRIQSENGFNVNGFAFNGFSFNGFSFNGSQLQRHELQRHGVQRHELSTACRTTACRTTACRSTACRRSNRRPVAHERPDDDRGRSPDHQVHGQDRVPDRAQPDRSTTSTATRTRSRAPSASHPRVEFGICDVDCQEKMSAALLAHVNNSGLHVGIWLVGPDNGIGWGSSPNFPFQEAAYFGNLFGSNMPGNYCAGKNMGAGDSKGRLGSPFGNNDAIMNAPYLWAWDNSSNQNVPRPASLPARPAAPFRTRASRRAGIRRDTNRAWNHVVTVYRNFEPRCSTRSATRMAASAWASSTGPRERERRAAHLQRRCWPDLDRSRKRHRASTRSSTSRAACRST